MCHNPALDPANWAKRSSTAPVSKFQQTHVLHAFVHLRTFFGIFIKQCVFIVLMTIASNPPNSAFLSETYCCFGDKKDFQFGQSILNFHEQLRKIFLFLEIAS